MTYQLKKKSKLIPRKPVCRLQAKLPRSCVHGVEGGGRRESVVSLDTAKLLTTRFFL